MPTSPVPLGNYFGAKMFHMAPFFKFLLLMLWSWSIMINFSFSSHMKYYFNCSLYDIITKKQVWRLFTRNFACVDLKDLIISSFLISHVMVFERRLGSRKFISYAVGKLILATALELCAVLFCDVVFQFKMSRLPVGPFGFILPFIVDLHYDVPRITLHHFMGIPITAMSYTYFMTLNVLCTSPLSLMSGICAMIAGLLHRQNFLKIKDIVVIPKFLSDLTSKTVGRVLCSSARNSNMMIGATLEIQRQQLFDLVEQNAIAQQLAHGQQNYAGALRNSENLTGGASSSWFNGQTNTTAEVPDQMIQSLVDMGFDRQRVLAALRTSNNNLNLATSILLNER